MQESKVDVSWKTINSHLYLKFEFKGQLTEELATEAILKWKAELTAKSEKSNLIFHCKAMVGYEANARKEWQKCMKLLKPKIGTIWVISESSLYITAARSMGVVTGFKIKAARHEEFIE